jgi:hypothetical protein
LSRNPLWVRLYATINFSKIKKTLLKTRRDMHPEERGLKELEK